MGLRKVVLFVMCFTITRMAAGQVTHHVPGDFPTIQQAIDASSDGDTVLVGYGTNGVYNEAINLGVKSITVASSAGGPAFTVIDAGSTGTSAVTVDGATNAKLDGFTIRHGSGTPIQLLTEMIVGGGIFVASGNVNIANCVIESNTAQLGAGIYIGAGAVATFDGCTIRWNEADLGGGLFSNAGQPVVTDSLFRSNWAKAGAGAFIVGDGTFTDSRFAINNAWTEGGGLIAAGGHTNIISCTFTGNVTVQRGGAMVIDEHATAEIIDSRFQSNSSIGPGGAIAIGPISDAAIAGTIFCDNHPDAIAGAWDDGGGNSFVEVCPDTCQGHCGGQSADGCWCDSMCHAFIDCCEDKCDHCGSPYCDPTNQSSCWGSCGGGPPQGCWCDNVCFVFGDCCGDVCEACDYQPCQGGRGSCIGLCGNYLHPSGCGCRPECLDEGNCCDDACAVCGHCKTGDLDGDGVVDVSDLLILLANWGPCPRSGECLGDLTGDGIVDVSDLLLLLGNWG